MGNTGRAERLCSLSELICTGSALFCWKGSPPAPPTKALSTPPLSIYLPEEKAFSFKSSKPTCKGQATQLLFNKQFLHAKHHVRCQRQQTIHLYPQHPRPDCHYRTTETKPEWAQFPLRQQWIFQPPALSSQGQGRKLPTQKSSLTKKSPYSWACSTSVLETLCPLQDSAVDDNHYVSYLFLKSTIFI